MMDSNNLAWLVRRHDVEMTHISGGSHIGAVMSVADIMAVLYADVLHYRAAEPRWDGRDRLIMSKGHAGAALYAALAECGFFPAEDLLTLRQIGSHLQGHPNMNLTPGVDMSTGSLGQGISAAVGMALGAKHQGKTNRVYTLLGDGEIQEGQVWEAMMAAAHYKLDNLVVIVDNNGLQIDGKVADVMSPYPIPEKMRAFGLEVVEIDGHDYDQMEAAFAKARETKGKPFGIVMKTTKGKCVSFMENQASWHGKAPNDEEYEIAMKELEAHLAEVEAM